MSLFSLVSSLRNHAPLQISEENRILRQAAMGEDTGGAEDHRERAQQLFASEYKAKDRLDRCGSRSRLDVPQSEAEAVAADRLVSLSAPLLLPAALRALVGEGNVGESLPASPLALLRADAELGNLLAQRQKPERRRKGRRRE